MSSEEAEKADTKEETLLVTDKESYLQRILSPMEESAEHTEPFREVIEERYNLCMLFYCLLKKDAEAKEPRYGALDTVWVEAHFADLVSMPHYMLLKSTPSCEVELNPLISHGKRYSIFHEDDESVYVVVRQCDDLTNTVIETMMGGVLDIKIDDGKLYAAVPFDDLISTIYDAILVYDCSTDMLIKTLVHPSIRCLEIYDGKLYSGSDDCTIKVWNLSTDEVITTLVGDTYGVRCLTAYDGKLYSGSGDCTIKIWNCSTNKVIDTLPGHTSFVSCLRIHDGKLYSGSSGGGIKIWNCSDRKLIATLEGHSGGVTEFLFLNDKLYSKDFYGSIKIWKL